MAFAWLFLQLFFTGLLLVAPLLVMLAASAMSLGLIVAKLERWSWASGCYWACITATTVGYGDLRPTHPLARVLAVLVALIGIIFTGIMLAVALQTAAGALEVFPQVELLETMRQLGKKPNN